MSLFDSIKTFFRERGRDIVYALVLLIFFGIGALVFLWSVVFLTRTINSLTGRAQTAETAPFGIDLVKFQVVASRLRIPFTPQRRLEAVPEPALPPPEPLPPPQEVQGATTSPLEGASEEKSSQEAKLDVSKISVRILNGTPTAGLAKTWEGYFKEEGFANTSIGNAAKKNYAGFTIQYKQSAGDKILAKAKEIITAHGAKVSAESQAVESEKYDIAIIIGK